MKTTHTLLFGTIFAVALSSCDSTYSDWATPGVIKRTGNQMSISTRTQVQPTFPTPQVQDKKEAAKPATQVQPDFNKTTPKPEPPSASPVQTEAKKIESTPALKPVAPRSTQVQPEFKQPETAPVKQSAQVQPDLSSQQRTVPQQLRPVMTPAQREYYPVMPGQNRALKRRR